MHTRCDPQGEAFLRCCLDERDLDSDISHITYSALDVDANFSEKPSPQKIDTYSYHDLLGLVKLR